MLCNAVNAYGKRDVATLSRFKKNPNNVNDISNYIKKQDCHVLLGLLRKDFFLCVQSFSIQNIYISAFQPSNKLGHDTISRTFWA